MNQFQDVEKQCKDCGNTFVFTAGEQEFFKTKDLTPPSRCQQCRMERKKQKQREEREGQYRQN